MPSRKIPKNHLFVTGAYASSKSDVMIGFESLLEKEYMLLLDFDPTVEKYVEQPVTLPVPGKSRRYTPDLLVTFRENSTGHRPPAQLIEIKNVTDKNQQRINEFSLNVSLKGLEVAPTVKRPAAGAPVAAPAPDARTKVMQAITK